MNELQQFVFEGVHVRGALVRLRETWRSVLADHHYPRELERLLGESVAATLLLGSVLKNQPKVSMQLQGEGRLSLLLVQCAADRSGPSAHPDQPTDAASGEAGSDGGIAHNGSGALAPLRVRGMAQWREQPDGGPWLHDGRMAVNVETGGANGLYQGIVPLVSNVLSECLESYFRQSEQLPTRLFLRSAEESAAVAGADAGVSGLLLQVLPGATRTPELFEELTALANTVSTEELNDLPADILLQRLFAGHTLRLFRPRPVMHDCRCTPDHLADVVRMLGEAELRSLLTDPGWVELNCEFCNRAFRYDESGIDAVLRGEAPGARLH